MFKSKIKMLPTRPGERLSSSHPTNKSFTDLGYKTRISIKNYITDFISKKYSISSSLFEDGRKANIPLAILSDVIKLYSFDIDL